MAIQFPPTVSALGVVTATSVAIGGATISSNALAVTGTVNISGNTTLGSSAQLLWSTDLIVTRAGAANIRHGAAAVDTGPVAQTISVQNVLAGGTSDVAGAALTIAGSQGKGTGVGGAINLQTAPAGSTGTAVNPLVTALSIAGSGVATFLPATAPPAAGAATAGILMSSTANLGIFFGSAAPTFVAAQGSVYLRTDGSTIATRFYVNTDGSATWTNFVTAT